MCQTIDNFDCIFPFKYENHTYWSCSDAQRNDLPDGSQWCATDTDQTGHFKSVGECKPNCQTSKNMICIDTLFGVNDLFPFNLFSL